MSCWRVKIVHCVLWFECSGGARQLFNKLYTKASITTPRRTVRSGCQMENKEGKEEGQEVNLGIESWTLIMQLYKLGVVRAITFNFY